MTSPCPNQATSYIAWKAWDDIDFGKYQKKDSIYFTAELKNAGIKVGAETRVLEIGFGNATFAGWVTEITTNYVGTEANLQLVQRAKKRGFEAHSGNIDLKTLAAGRKFDLIVAFDVFEHLEIDAIITALLAAADCLSTNGHIVFRVPSGDSPFSGPLMYGDITHKTKLGSRAVVQIANLTGLEVVSTHEVTVPLLGMGIRTALSGILVLTLRKIIGTIIKITFNGNKSAIISNNMMAVLKLNNSHTKNKNYGSSGSFK